MVLIKMRRERHDAKSMSLTMEGETGLRSSDNTGYKTSSSVVRFSVRCIERKRQA